MLGELRTLAADGWVWIKALHIVGVVCWFAALFYLPRLFVYHAMANDPVGIERFKIMERKLYRGIANPSMVATIVFGFGLFLGSADYYLASGWFWIKIVLVLLLIVYHFLCLYFLKRFRDDRNTRGHRFYRWFNELPVLLLIGITLLVVVKPF